MNLDQLIIEHPHLQTVGQRIGSLCVSLLCWGLWIYFLVPLVSLSGWLLGVRKFSAEVRWFGGYKSLIELLQLYGLTILAILAVWLIWTLYTTLRHQRSAKRRAGTGQPATTMQDFALAGILEHRPQGSCVTAVFNEHGQIIALRELYEPVAPTPNLTAVS